MHGTERKPSRAAIVAALALAACGAAPDRLAGGDDGIQPDPPSGPTVALGFALDAPAAAYTSLDAFELFTTTRIRIVADFANAGPDGAERLELRAPGGNLWYGTVIPFTGATGSDRSVTVLPDGSYRVIYVLEVAGTTIETYQRTGTWIAIASLDGADVSASKAFELY
jgi:hypothetical protein